MIVARIVILGLAAACALTVLFFLIRGIRPRLSHKQYAYGVAQQEARHEMQVNLLRAGFLFVVTIILLSIYGLVPAETMTEATETPVPQASPTRVAPVKATDAAEATPTEELLSPSPRPADPIETETPAVTMTVAATETPEEAIAIVNSPNGLWLREAPGGTLEVELIPHQSRLELLPGRQTAEDLDWQQVRTEAGNEGWVATDFLIFP